MADEIIGAICGAICEGCGPLLAGIAECMFACIKTGCVPLIECLCWISCVGNNRSCWLFDCFCDRNSSSRRNSFDGCFYIALACLAGAAVIGILALGIYALAQFVQDANPAVAAGVACAILDQTLTGLSFSAFATTFGRNKGMTVNTISASPSPITVINRCFNNNEGSAKFRVDGKLAA